MCRYPPGDKGKFKKTHIAMCTSLCTGEDTDQTQNINFEKLLSDKNIAINNAKILADSFRKVFIKTNKTFPLPLSQQYKLSVYPFVKKY